MDATIHLPVPMRARPSAVEFSTLGVRLPGIEVYAVTGITLGAANTKTAELDATVASGLTQYRPYNLQNNNNTAGYLGLSAEL